MTSPSSAQNPRQSDLLNSPSRILIRDLYPVTPSLSPAKAVRGDEAKFGAMLVADGHGLLAARLRWRRADSQTNAEPSWQRMPLVVAASGQATGQLGFEAEALYEFQIQAWADRFETWRRDLQLFAQAGEPLQLEFEQGALILESLQQLLPAGSTRRIV
ncbi:MAG: DUF3416 domain-containing protein, partial [Actinobacteria bacterium]|nr:DUF3416 domain-containing protein [Actinomycetota bacterium]